MHHCQVTSVRKVITLLLYFAYLILMIKDNNIERLTVKNYFEYPPLTINEQQNRIEIMKALNMSKIEEQEEETKQRTIYHN